MHTVDRALHLPQEAAAEEEYCRSVPDQDAGQRIASVVLLSGGLDSSTLLYHTRKQFESTGGILALSLSYGQRHIRELAAAEQICQRCVGVSFYRAALPMGLQGLSHQSGRTIKTDHDPSVLLDHQRPMPEGHYAAENMRATVVQNRNALFLAYAYSVAAALGAQRVCTAVHAGDHAIYPDCRPEFIRAFQAMEDLALSSPAPELYAPFVSWSKADIVRHGTTLGVPWKATWSCYHGQELHCGRCGTCVERIWAFHAAKVYDPTHYQDGGYAYAVAQLKEKGEW